MLRTSPIREVYLKATSDIVAELRVRPDQGLSQKEAARRTKEWGQNIIAVGKGQNPFLVFTERFTDPLVLILLAAVGISLFMREFADAVIISVAILFDAALTFFQVWRTEKTLEKIREHVKQTATVIRDGILRRVSAEELVPGDIIEVRAGEKVPADARLIEVSGLSIQEAALTGESEDVQKKTTRLLSRTPLANRVNMMYLGTLVVNGTGKAIVTSTGTRTEFGKIAQVLKTEVSPASPLRKKLAKTSKMVGWGILGAIILLSVLSILQGVALLETLRTAVTLVVSAIPEHLTMILTICLTVGVARILRKRGVVRQLHSVETLGAATVICTDKTGTLTKGEMMAVAFDFLQGTVLSDGQAPTEPVQAFAYLALAMASDARRTTGEQNYIGSATERTALAFAESAGFNQEKLRKQWRQYDSITFSPQWKYRISLTAHPSQATNIFFATGAPDILLEKSSHMLNEKNEVVALTDKQRHVLQKKMEQHASRGDRLLGVAVHRFYKKSDITHSDIHGMIFMGVLIIRDPIRAEARLAIHDALSAGIQVKIVTGDHETTARAVARGVGLTATDEVICSGSELAQMSDIELSDIIDRTIIFARVTPLDKERIIRTLQAKGHVVAMTGDGVNDAVALKGADIGVAMGSGKDIAKDAADLVLLDDNFVTIVDAVREGRIVRDNIRKVIGFLLATNVAEILVFFGSILLRLPLPFIPAQILWINLVTDGTSDIALSFDPEESNVMHRKPEDPNAPLFSRLIIWHIVFSGLVMTLSTVALYAYSFVVLNLPLDHAQTIAFAFLSVSSLLSVWSWRSLRTSMFLVKPWSNKWLPFSAAFSFGLQLVAIYMPGFRSFFNTVPLSLVEWGYIVGIAFLTVCIIDLRKLFGARHA